ncbi:hypothetical protein QJS10_CPA02g01552 [Acorus calamus]|uniref:Choline monooxygenase, chloroplastic n=1 Tax=Acorus calamus TaxID=4465 RepID=A0AAV9FAH7_ACOCL|nr:hypothetical protein QJS10_CPA02g01552 [Acorus calamus]
MTWRPYTEEEVPERLSRDIWLIFFNEVVYHAISRVVRQLGYVQWVIADLPKRPLIPVRRYDSLRLQFHLEKVPFETRTLNKNQVGNGDSPRIDRSDPQIFVSVTSLDKSRRPDLQVVVFWCASSSSPPPPWRAASASSSSPPAAASNGALELARDFDPMVPLEEAWTPPSSWYTDPGFLSLEIDRVFFRGWQAVGYVEQIKNPHDFFTGSLWYVAILMGTFMLFTMYVAIMPLFLSQAVVLNLVSYALIMGGLWVRWIALEGYSDYRNTELQHECMLEFIVEPFHVLFTLAFFPLFSLCNDNPILIKPMTQEFGLVPIKVATWGPFVLISMDEGILSQQKVDDNLLEDQWLGSSSKILSTSGIDSSLYHVFCDNYLDGGYHVPYAHPGLASGLRFNSYSTECYDSVSRRYGPWMDTNLVLPLGASKCQVIFDYFLDSATLKDDQIFIEKSLEESERVQVEDIALCEGVQKGLESLAYCSGRYAPTVEKAMHHFHCLLHEDLTSI